MPVVRHQRVAEQAHAQTLPALKQDFLEGSIIARLAEQRGPAHRTIQNVVDISGIRATSPTSHVRKLLERVGVVKEINLTPFIFGGGLMVETVSIDGEDRVTLTALSALSFFPFPFP